MSNEPSMIIGGAFQDSGGNPLAFGLLRAQLNRDAYTDNTYSTLVCAGEAIEIALDENGNVAGTQYLWPNDLLIDVWTQVADTFYSLSAFSAEGQLAWGPNSLFLDTAGSYQFAIQQSFPANGTSYPLLATPVTESVSVYVNGLQQSNFTVSGSIVTMGFTPNPGNLVSFSYFTSPGIAISSTFEQEVPSGSGTSFSLSHTPVTNSLALYRGAGPDYGALLQTPGVDYTLSGTYHPRRDHWHRYALRDIPEFGNFDRMLPGDSFWRCEWGESHICTSKSMCTWKSSVFWDGGYLTPDVDYTLASDNQTCTLTFAPTTGSLLRAYYVESLNVINLNLLAPQNPS